MRVLKRFSKTSSGQKLIGFIFYFITKLISCSIRWEYFEQSKKSKIFETVGYKEWLPYWNGKSGKSVIIENIKKNTRRYAKRQITWIKKYKNATWLKPKEAILKIIGNHK